MEQKRGGAADAGLSKEASHCSHVWVTRFRRASPRQATEQWALFRFAFAVSLTLRRTGLAHTGQARSTRLLVHAGEQNRAQPFATSDRVAVKPPPHRSQVGATGPGRAHAVEQ